MLESQILITLVVVAAIIIFWRGVDSLFRRKLRRMVGHQRLSNSLSIIFAVVVLIYLLNVWGVIQAIVELTLTFGTISAVLLWAMKDVWISNIFAGISLIGDRNIRIGTEVEIGGQRGKIVEISLTVTKLRSPDGRLIIVPNQVFRASVVVINTKKKQR
ncbi:MAG: mechanosensitive ion channel family protein [Candidatus Hadarchaeum sp.]|uniref:mechanosensitive ion channel family protein n=1 Tax=Candidatus Hadarchaeum sp. TaxID=2883567 RepID=UPI003D0DB87B